jgi:hypothetical protein
MHELNGSKILFIAPKFFGYEKEIISEMESLGAKVNWLPDRPFDSPIMKGVTRLAPRLVTPFADLLYEKLLYKWGVSHYNFILVINGQTLSNETLKKLRVSFPRAKFILYMWDSFDNRPGIIKKLNYFDTLLSFDPKNVSYYGMQERPLFYGKGFQKQRDRDNDFDLSFIGTIHSDRYTVINYLRSNLPKSIKTYWHLYLQAPWVYYAFRLTKPAMKSASKKEFTFTPLDKESVHSIFLRSRAIIDIEHPNQQGLTMRTIESFGSNKKIVTTNKNIINSDIYNCNNVCIIDRKKPVIPKIFINNTYESPSETVYKKYSISGWLNDVLCLNKTFP